MNNKRYILIVVLTFILTLTLSAVLSACDLNAWLYGEEKKQEEEEKKDDTKEECDHDWQLSANGVRSTCVTQGYELYICTKCKAEQRKTLPVSTQHVYTGNVCIYCGAKAPAVESFTENGVTVLMYYALGVASGDDYKEYQLIFDGNGNIDTVLWSKYRTLIRSVRIDGNVGLPDNAFAGNEVLNELSVPGAITRIGENAFAGCTELTSLSLSPAIEHIGKNAFAGCTSLTNVTIGGSPYIGRGAFSGCERLRTLSVPQVGTEDHQGASVLFGSLFSVSDEKNGNQFLDDAYFLIPDSLRSVSITDERSIRSYAFANFSVPLENLTISSLTETIEYRAFYNNQGVEHVVFEDGSQLSTIEESAFDSCEKLQSFSLPAGVSSILPNTFARCRRLSEFVFAEDSTLTLIKSNAFLRCSSLNSLIFPAGVEMVESNAFSYCTALEEICLSRALKSIGPDAFFGCSSLNDVRVLSADIANCSDNNSHLFGSGSGFSLWIEKSITVNDLGYVGKNYHCPMAHITTEKNGYDYYLWSRNNS